MVANWPPGRTVLRPLVAALFFAGVAGGLPPAAASATPTTVTYSSSATVSPATVAPGQSVSIGATLTSNAVSTALVDLEMYDRSSAKVFQQVWDNQSFSAGQPRMFSSTWQVPASAAVGSYAVKIGVFSPGWGTLYYWNDGAATLIVSAAPANTPTTVPTSTPTAVPTSAPSAVCSQSLQALIDAAPAGSVLHAPNCIFRETVTINKPLTLDGASGANIRGSDVFSTWTASGVGWVSQSTVPVFDISSNQGVCADRTNTCNWPEQVFVDGRPLTQVAPVGTPASGQFTLDGARHVVLADNPAGHVVEVSTRTRWINTLSDNVTVQNFTLVHAANAAQTGAIGNQNRNGWTLQDSKLYYAHGGIVSLGGASNANTQTRVLRNTIAGSSYIGINGYMNTNTLIQGNTIYDNNLARFDPAWGGGGVKIVSFTNTVLDNNTLHNNFGPALWCDIECVGTTYSHNRIHDQEGVGIMEEISTGGHITGNVIWNIPNNIFGIYVSSSAGTEVDHNTVAFTIGGIQTWVVNRSDRPAGAGTNLYVHDNSVIQSSSDTNSMVWADDGSTSITATESNNRGLHNSFWYPVAEDGASRFVWGHNYFASIGSYTTTPGGPGSYYLSTAQKDSKLTALGVPH
jgi:Right handed beta helix region